MVAVQCWTVRGAVIQHHCSSYAAVDGRVEHQQQRLQELNCDTSTSGQEAEELSIMGWGMLRVSIVYKSMN